MYFHSVFIRPRFQKIHSITENDQKKEIQYLAHQWRVVLVGVWDVHDVWIWTVFGTCYKTFKCFFNCFIVNAQCTPVPVKLGFRPVYISNTDPRICSCYTPLWMITWRKPVTQTSFYSFDVEHFIYGGLGTGCGWTVGTFTERLATPGLDIQITADCLCNSDVKISIWKNKEPQKPEILC